jgi:hypothetical protein
MVFSECLRIDVVFIAGTMPQMEESFSRDPATPVAILRETNQQERDVYVASAAKGGITFKRAEARAPTEIAQALERAAEDLREIAFSELKTDVSDSRVVGDWNRATHRRSLL